MFCKKCGSELSTLDETCPKCGTPVNEKFSTEKYDPLVALDKEGIIEDNLIWQEAPLDEDTIIINAEEGRPMEEKIEEKAEQIVSNFRSQESELNENMTQGIRAAKSTIANPIKPKRRVKPQTTVQKVVKQEETIPEVTQTEVAQEVTVPETKVVEEVKTVPEPVVQETVEEVKTVTEEVVEEIPREEIIEDEVVDLFDDFVVDDSFAIIDESPEIIEEVPPTPEPVVEEKVAPKAPVIEETPVATEVVEEHVVEDVPVKEEVITEEVVTEDVVEEVPQETIATEVVDTQAVEEVSESIDLEAQAEEIIQEPIETQEITPEDALFADEPIIDSNISDSEPLIESYVEAEKEAISSKEEFVEEIIEDTSAAEDTTKNLLKDESADKIPQSVKTDVDLEEIVKEDPIITSINKTKIDKSKVEPMIDDRDNAIKSKFNSSFEDELEDIPDVDENINSLTSKITTVLIIVLILIIAIVVATFLVQNMGL